MKRLIVLSVTVLASLSGVASVTLRADQSNQPSDRLRLAFQEPSRLIIPAWPLPPPKRLGVGSITPPETRGEVIQISVPIGALTMRVARSVGNAQYHRAERKAREEVERAIKAFDAPMKEKRR